MKAFFTPFIASVFAMISGFTHAQGWSSVSPLIDGFVSNHSFGFAIDSVGYLVAGETTDGYSTAFYQYDPAADTWSALEDFPGPARGYTIGDTWDGKAWIGFGMSNNGALNDLWMFDPAVGQWEEKASCPCSARTHPAFIAEAGKIFMGMGGGPNGDMNDWWEYDMETDAWSQKPDFPSTERHHPYQFGIDGMVYVGFGHHAMDIFNEWYRYNPTTEEWTEMAELPAEGRVAGTQLTHNGFGYALSGDGDDHSSMETGEMWQYDPLTDTWTEWPVHPGMSRWAPASFVLNDEVYLINGMSMDPGTFDYMTTNWKMPMIPTDSLDLGLISYVGNEVICTGEEQVIAVRMTNWGNATIFAGDAIAINFEMEVNGEIVLSSDWSGFLDTYESTEFVMGTYAFSESTSFTLRANLEDQNMANNEITASVAESVQGTTQWAVELLTDNWGGEVGWRVEDASGQVIAAGGPGEYNDESLYNFNVALPSTGCYTFHLTDEYGDGMFGSMWGGSNGYCTVTALDDAGEALNVVFNYDGTYAYGELIQTIDVTTSVSTSEVLASAFIFLAHPNPVQDQLIITWGEEFIGRGNIEIIDTQGRLLASQSLTGAQQLVFDASDWPSGLLLIQGTREGQPFVNRVLKID